MTNLADTVHTLLLGLTAFYTLVHVVLCILAIHHLEKPSLAVPDWLAQRITPRAHEKARALACENIQTDLIAALTGALAVFLLTVCRGYQFILAVTHATFRSPFVQQCVLLAAVLILLALLDAPGTWYRNYLIRKRYRLERRTMPIWIVQTGIDTLCGLAVTLFASFALLAVLSLLGRYWWIGGFVASMLFYFARQSNALRLYLRKRGSSEPDDSRTADLCAFLSDRTGRPFRVAVASQGERMPRSGAVYLPFLRPATLIVSQAALERLDDVELRCIALRAVRYCGGFFFEIRTVAFAVFSLTLFWGLSVLSGEPDFFRGLAIAPSLARIGESQVNLALMGTLLLVLGPVLLYPLVFLIHLLTRRLNRDADEKAMQACGLDPLVGSIVKLDEDPFISLTPHRMYSLANYRRPHPCERVAHLQALWRRSSGETTIASDIGQEESQENP